MPKAQLLCVLVLNKISDRALGEVEKGAVLLSQAKGATAGKCPQNQVSTPAEDSEKL